MVTTGHGLVDAARVVRTSSVGLERETEEFRGTRLGVISALPESSRSGYHFARR